jgi:tetratricopeptide (TPR) repeat protein
LNGEVSAFEPKPTPTRTAGSFSQEGQAFFSAGNLDKAIEAYQDSIITDPSNARLRAELSQVQVYSSAMLTTDAERKTRLQDALTNINRAVELAPRDSYIHGTRTLTWSHPKNELIYSSRRRMRRFWHASWIPKTH